MARTLNADLATAQKAGSPTGGYQPSVRCQITDGTTTHDYTFDPTVNTNTLLHVLQDETRSDDSGVILLQNNNRTKPPNLIGYYVDLGWGRNTSAGLKNSAANGAVSPRLWVMAQQDISGAPKNQKNQIYTVLELAGVWRAVLNTQEMRLGTSPYYRDNRNDVGGSTIAALTGKTVYGCIEYLIETSLTAQTGKTFTLKALGQDDGLISTIVPFPATGQARLQLNMDTPAKFETYGEFINRLLGLTQSFMRATDLTGSPLYFEIIWPQSSDAVNETYYSVQSATKHPFYEVTDVKVGKQSDGTALPNHFEVWGDSDADDVPDVFGEYYDSDHYTTVNDGSFVIGTVYHILTIGGSDFTTIGAGANTIGTIFTATGANAGGSGTAVTYTGPFMDVGKTYYEPGVTTAANAALLATALYKQVKSMTVGAVVKLPMDASVELYDRVEVQDQRGH